MASASAKPASPAITGGQDFTVIGDGERYVMQCREVPIAFEAEKLREEFGKLHAQVTVYCGLAGTKVHDGEVLTTSWENLATLTSRQRFGATLEKIANVAEVDWRWLHERFANHIFRALAVGRPSILLSEVPDRADDGYYDILGVKLARTGKTGIYGKGDSLKSIFSLYSAGEIAKQGRAVSFFDFEWTGEEHKARARKLWPDGDMPPIRYRQCTRALVHEAESLRRDVLVNNTQFFVIDSIVPACHDKPESADTATAFNRAASYIAGTQAGQLWVGHVVKSKENVAEGEETFFGSVFWGNLIRCGWYVKAQPGPEGGPVVCAYHHRKRNGLPQLPSVGVLVSFHPERIQFLRADLGSDPELAVGMPLWQRMRDALKQGPRSMADLVDELDAKPEAIKKAAQRAPRLFTKLEGGMGIPPRLALVERRSS